MMNRPKLEVADLQNSIEAIENLLREEGEEQVRERLAEHLRQAAEATREISIERVVDPGFFDKVFTV